MKTQSCGIGILTALLLSVSLPAQPAVTEPRFAGEAPVGTTVSDIEGLKTTRYRSGDAIGTTSPPPQENPK